MGGTPLPARLSRPGELVHLRSRRWLVEQVVQPPGGGSPRVALACADDDNQGRSLTVFWDWEPDRRILEGESWQDLAARGFDPPRRFAAFLRTLRWHCTTSTDPHLFQAPFRAGITIDAYQMEPLRKALRLPRVNLFIADDTGLGKTIEAGLIARELLLRRRVKTIVVAAPPSVLDQWRSELEERFGLVFATLDRAWVARMRRERGFGVNPWRTHSRFLVSHNLLIDPTYADPLREWLGPLAPGSLLILDEAHHAAPSSGGRYGIETKITRAVRDLGRRFEHRLFLSATPHNGHSNSFSTLLELLDPYRFTRGVPVRRQALGEVMVRRLKEDIRAVQGGFPRRAVERIEIAGLPAEAPELLLSRLLDEYRTAREARHADASGRARAAAGLLVVGLQQRLLSSIEAFARSLAVHRRTVERQWTAAAPGGAEAADSFLRPPDADDERGAWDDEDLEAEEREQIEALDAAAAAPDAGTPLPARERELLDRMQQVAEAASQRPDAKTRRLLDWIRAHLCPGLPPFGERPRGPAPRWNGRRVLIFTENRQGTRRYLRTVLEQAVAHTDRGAERVETIDGLTGGARRREVQRRFNADPARDPLRILLATDAAREGLNFQAHCTDLFHFDLPWNPGRIEQRNGRIDRKLQPAPEVRCHYFVLPQRAEDRVLEVLVRKTATIRAELGSLSKVIDDDVKRRLTAGGIRHRDADRLARELEAAGEEAGRRRASEVAAEELEAARERQDDLRAQIERCRTLLARSREWVGFEAAPFRDALSCALELLGAEPLRPGPDAAGGAAWTFPALDRRSAADPSWAATLDTLRVPRKADQKLADWRRDAPIRPVVFADPGLLGDDTVHLHLEQRVAQRLLARFRAQGFVRHDLSRACLAQAADSIPRVILLGRLSLYGRGAERLHEEIVPVAARWTDPSRRGGPLRAYARDAETRTLDLLERSLGRPGAPAQVVRERLLAAAPRDGIVGNPPFQGGKRISTVLGGEYRDWLAALHTESSSNTDLVAHFFRRAFTLLREGGAFGLIATNTIAQGDTRSGGLRWICTHGGDIYRARRRLKWPGLAAVVVSVVHVHKGPFPVRRVSTVGSADGHLPDADVTPAHLLDEAPVERITAFLFHRGGHHDPARLAANAGKSFVGSFVLGMGFTFDDADRRGVASPLAVLDRFLTENPQNMEVIFPFIGGEDVNSSPTHAHHRYIINFHDYPLRRKGQNTSSSRVGAPDEPWYRPSPDTSPSRHAAGSWAKASDDQRRAWLRQGIVPTDYPGPVAADWPELLAIVEERVKPERDVQNRKALRERWWHYADKRPALYAAIAAQVPPSAAERQADRPAVPMRLPRVAIDIQFAPDPAGATDGRRVLVNSQVSQWMQFAFLPADMVYAHTLNIFPLDTYSAFCIFQSRPHETWARFFASSLGDGLRYTPSDCFETFPFPAAWETQPALEKAGRHYYDFRAALLQRNDEGLTKTYNRFHDPDEDAAGIAELRRLHAAMNRAVLDAYGWPDIPTDCGFLLDYALDEDETGARKKPYRYRWPDAVRDEVLARLLELNAQRAAEERRAGTAPAAATSRPKAATPSHPRPAGRRAGESQVAGPRPLWGSSDE